MVNDYARHCVHNRVKISVYFTPWFADNHHASNLICWPRSAPSAPLVLLRHITPPNIAWFECRTFLGAHMQGVYNIKRIYRLVIIYKKKNQNANRNAWKLNIHIYFTEILVFVIKKIVMRTRLSVLAPWACTDSRRSFFANGFPQATNSAIKSILRPLPYAIA